MCMFGGCCAVAATSAPRWTRLLQGVRAGAELRCWCCAARPGSARPRCWSSSPSRPPGVASRAPPACRPRWSLPFAGLHHLCAPLLDGMRDAAGAAAGRAARWRSGCRTGAPPDRFLVALAVLSLLAEAAEARPLVCLIDDAQWLDRASAQVLAFVARRLLAERDRDGLRRPRAGRRRRARRPAGAARRRARRRATPARCWTSVVPGRVDERVRERILAETRGNPLALLELPRGLTPAELAGGFGLPDARPLAEPHRADLPASASRRFRATRSGCC